MVGLFRGLKRLMAGEKLETADLTIHDGATKVSLILKREKESGELYVVLVNVSAGNNHYSVFEPAEFDRFADSVFLIQSSLRHREHGAD